MDGVLAGDGGILVFLPGLFMMYLLLAILEQSGYMARAAFVMDRFMNKARLHGKSFIPMILGFGCNVPAIYATRTIKKTRSKDSYESINSIHVLFRPASCLLDFWYGLFPRQIKYRNI